MARILIGNWWALAQRGAAAILLVIVALLSPPLTDWTLILLFAAYAFVDGIFGIAGMRAAAYHGRPWPLLLEGVVDIAAAVPLCNGRSWRRLCGSI